MSSCFVKFFATCCILFPAVSTAASIVGNWCPHGQPYTCYPPVQHDSETYICIDSSTITIATDETLKWVVNETHHFYEGGVTTGKSKPEQVSTTFSRDSNFQQPVYISTNYTGEVTQLHRFTIKDNRLILEFIQTPEDSDAPHLNQQTTYSLDRLRRSW